MGTSNFRTQEQFSLYAWNYEYIYDEQYKKDWEENNEGMSFDVNRAYEDEVFFIVEDFDTVLTEVLNKFNKTLNFYKVELKDGYYMGLQFYVEEDAEILKHYYIQDITNEDTRYYEDMCLSQFKRKLTSEINFINKRLLPELAKRLGFIKLNCIGVFSNGEAVYEKAA